MTHCCACFNILECVRRIEIGNRNKYEIDLKLRLTDRELKCQNRKEIFDMESANEYNPYTHTVLI